MARRSLFLGLVVALLALPAPAGAVLSGKNGRIVFINGPAFGNTKLFLRSVTSSTGAGSRSGPLMTGLSQQHRHPTWSPDRTKIAFAEGTGSYDIWILDLTTPGANPKNLTDSTTTSDDRPAWSPDGTRIAYESGNDIIVHPLNGGSDLNLTTTLTPKAWKAAWSPDSQTLYYSVGDITQPPNGTNNDIRIYQQPANNSSAGTELVHISGVHVFQPAVSPDGTKLCYTTSAGAGNSITAAVVAVSLSAPNGPFTTIASGVGDYNCTWSPDGTKIAYTDDYAANGEVYMRNSDGSGIPIDLSNAPGEFDGNPDWAPDGRPVCPDSNVATQPNTPLTFQVTCNDTGPEYEQTEVRETADTQPAHGTLTQGPPGDPFTYTPNPGFVGTDSFQVKSIDDFGFGSDRGTVTIDVRPSAAIAKCRGKVATISGTGGSDEITGTAGRDIIVSFGGSDVIRGGRGKDLVCSGRGRDRVVGGGGRDTLDGGASGDRLSGKGGNDTLIGRGGRDTLIGGAGRDRLKGGARRDRLIGGTGRDRLSGGSGRDRLNGGRSTDRCSGGSGTDTARACELLLGIP
jgi:Ca2+-binding RTX toxin-like protein